MGRPSPEPGSSGHAGFPGDSTETATTPGIGPGGRANPSGGDPALRVTAFGSDCGTGMRDR